jgi:xanthine dehydrogenase YagS FAD-binding subunit
MNGNTIQSARVVLGAVAPVPWRSEDAERALAGKPLNEQTATEAADAACAPLTAQSKRIQGADRTHCGKARCFAGGGTAGREI